MDTVLTHTVSFLGVAILVAIIARPERVNDSGTPDVMRLVSKRV